MHNAQTEPIASGLARRDLLALAAAAFVLPISAVAPDAARAAPDAIDTPEARAALREALVANIVRTKAPAVLR